MVEVVNRNQQVKDGALRPDPAYSRLEALELHIPAGLGNQDYCYTPVLGNSLVLYGINIWIRCPTHPGTFGGYVYIASGASIPASAGVITKDWTMIVPLRCGERPGFKFILCEHKNYYLKMRKKYRYDEIRFGVVIENLKNIYWEATVLFEISEG